MNASRALNGVKLSPKLVEYKNERNAKYRNPCTVIHFKTGGLDGLRVRILCYMLSIVPHHVREWIDGMFAEVVMARQILYPHSFFTFRLTLDSYSALETQVRL